MSAIPIHKIIRQSDFGIFLKEISAALFTHPVEYVHRDEYYLFGMVDSGSCCVSIDFKDHRLSESEIMCTQPGQVHRVIDAGDAKIFLLLVDSVFVDASCKQIIAEYALAPVPLRMNGVQLSELRQLFFLISHRISHLEDDASKRIVQNLAGAVVGIVAEGIQNVIHRQPKNRRHLEIILAFKELLFQEDRISRSPSYYAALLHLSPVYLNEVIKDITGISASEYIQRELLLKAKRLLIYTDLNIKEIALELGIENYSYFTRLFAKVVGMPPTSYRKKYLK